MSTDLFIICILDTLAHPALKAWAGAYLPLMYFKSANEEPVYLVSSKSPNMSTDLFVTCILQALANSSLRALVWAYLPLQYFKTAKEESVYQVSSKLVQQ
ncbi:hypothetical protein AVEN_42649-1 [Araneus ventricosus]|uniref:Uncharacterized protein n=1 Tax=Araneus ventricosus TaxID=182803 RepID=A0A4Y2BPI9_ARAVE|nr:hypothetical protein AVEN_42649-1 [Araneus ventricosus]